MTAAADPDHNARRQAPVAPPPNAKFATRRMHRPFPPRCRHYGDSPRTSRRNFAHKIRNAAARSLLPARNLGDNFRPFLNFNVVRNNLSNSVFYLSTFNSALCTIFFLHTLLVTHHFFILSAHTNLTCHDIICPNKMVQLFSEGKT